MKWRNKVVLITGASSGIGEATAYELAERGALPVLVARRADELKRVAAEIATRFPGVQTVCIAADITRDADRRRIQEQLEKEFGRLDVLINNAGITAHGRFDESDPTVLRQALELNFFAAAELTGLLLPLLQYSRDERRAIALVSTPSGLYGVPGRFAYSASKAAGHAWMETLRCELHDDGIDAVIFCPGYTRTGLRTSGLAADGRRLSEEQSKHARDPEWMAGRLRRALEKGGRRVVLTGFQGSLVYWLRTLAPGLLEWLMRKKLKGDMKKTL
ncbi:MAG: SDR family NAD(P)-dependent oxidoreductase [bacterium]|nr:SDR family NAD(P)-dependent oxidoreductase [bacterium]